MDQDEEQISDDNGDFHGLKSLPEVDEDDRVVEVAKAMIPDLLVPPLPSDFTDSVMKEIAGRGLKRGSDGEDGLSEVDFLAMDGMEEALKEYRENTPQFPPVDVGELRERAKNMTPEERAISDELIAKTNKGGEETEPREPSLYSPN